MTTRLTSRRSQRLAREEEEDAEDKGKAFFLDQDKVNTENQYRRAGKKSQGAGREKAPAAPWGRSDWDKLPFDPKIS
jgi:hypothetical protein